jgi:uncharacterized DUF497 family protein
MDSSFDALIAAGECSDARVQSRLALEFAWDPQKAAANLAKHKVSFEEAASVFGDPLGRIVGDPRHSSGEARFVLLGLSATRRLLAVMYVDRARVIRIISARKATRHERRDYEEIT